MARLVHEPTDRHHRALVRAFAGWPPVKVNPLRARRFAKACARAKTDAGDARKPARTGARPALPPDPPVSAGLEEPRDLEAARTRLVRVRIAMLQQQAQARRHLPRRQVARSLRESDSKLAEIEAEIETRIGAEPDLAARRRILVSVPGFGPPAAAALVARMPEPGALACK